MNGTPRVQLRAGGYTAVVSEVGAAVRSLRYGDRELVLDTGEALPSPPFAGAMLAPWPNRIADGRYTFGGRSHQLPINDLAHGAALHGLALYVQWERVRGDGASVELRHTVRPQPGYPYTVELSAHFALDRCGLSVRLRARNRSAQAAPVGLSSHLHLAVGPDATLADSVLTVPASRVLRVDDRLQPTSLDPVDGTDLDFRAGRRVGSTVVDHAFTDLARSAEGHATATLCDASGLGARMTWTSTCPWVQVYTVASDDPRLHRRGVAIEPMTCPPDAFNRAPQDVRLEPDDMRSCDFAVAACG